MEKLVFSVFLLTQRASCLRDAARNRCVPPLEKACDGLVVSNGIKDIEKMV